MSPGCHSTIDWFWDPVSSWRCCKHLWDLGPHWTQSRYKVRSYELVNPAFKISLLNLQVRTYPICNNSDCLLSFFDIWGALLNKHSEIKKKNWPVHWISLWRQPLPWCMASRIRRWQAHLFLNTRLRRTSMPWLRCRLERRAVWLTYVLLLLRERPPFVPLPSWWYLQVTRHIDQVVTKSAIYPRDCLPYSYGRVLAHACSLFLNLHNTGFFPDYYLLSVTDESIWIPYLARYSEIFKKPNLQLVNRFFRDSVSFFGYFLKSDIPFFSFSPQLFLKPDKVFCVPRASRIWI